MFWRLIISLALALWVPSALSSPRLYVFDCGSLQFDDVSAFGLTNEETAVREMFVPCYLIEHERGRLLWDAGLPLSIAGKGELPLQPGARMRYDRSVIDQLADLNLRPAEIDYIALSHFHFDHAGAANAFSRSMLLVQRPEFVAAFKQADQHEVFDPSLYDKLANSPKQILHGDFDVFGDGKVQVISAPGHTPGHQVLFVDLERTGPLVLSGDLYHFRASRALKRTPVFNTDRPLTLASMKRVEQLIADTGATLWIEHDQALAETLTKAPQFYD